MPSHSVVCVLGGLLRRGRSRLAASEQRPRERAPDANGARREAGDAAWSCDQLQQRLGRVRVTECLDALMGPQTDNRHFFARRRAA